ncbi:hypothetical protein HUU42_01640 [bacterium]|nr:hypothetical protein [bacterium]
MKALFKFFWMIGLGACSYSFSGANVGNLKNVAIPVFDNLTSEPGIREKVTSDITNAIIEDNNLKVTDRRTADALLIGKITKLDDVPFAYEGSGNSFSTKDYKITIYTTIRFETVKDKKPVWEETISGWGRYSLTGSQNRNAGIEDAIKMITQNVVNKMVSNW